MRPCVSMLCVVGFLVAADDAKDKAVKEEMKKFDGGWQPVTLKANGQEVPAEDLKKVHVAVEGGQYTVKVEDNVVEKGAFTVDPGKKPKQIDMKATEGQNQGKSFHGIYELEGDDLKVCFAEADKDRPKEYAAEKDSGQVLHVYKRAKAK
ncbi:MAG TPA: TIGR03067 domain-containing protein [Gemmataceae bacterium]